VKALVITALALSFLAVPIYPRPQQVTEEPEESQEDASKLTAETFKGLNLRGIGPALTSGRVVDIAVNPVQRSQYFVAVASGGVWKTENWGTTWKPVFDQTASYSIGCITMDPNEPLVIWAGTGENASQRSVSYGDGVYKSIDGGSTWENVGLKDSEHIGKILVDPRDSSRVFVAAQGPLWAPGGDRGLYMTTDGGKSWKKALDISEKTGVSEVLMDPQNPDVMYAVSYQRRRHVWTLIDGGPESGIHKSMDGGESWRKVTRGLPGNDIGRIGIAVSTVDPKVLFAIVEAAGDSGGFFRSSDKGESWEKQSDYVSGSPQYYQEIVADPFDVERVYSLDTYLMVTEDRGKTFKQLGEKFKHVDNHAMWINPIDNTHLLVGCDGGVYESFDRGKTWDYKANLPITQFYRIAVDSAKPFYNIYGGTQDNYSLGGPSRTTNVNGITNSDWYVTKGGDGFETQVDPEDPDILYSQSQYGHVARFDRKTGERINIQPQPGKGGAALRWNWNSPLLISPHSHTRLYFAANRLFRSEDRGNSWTAISGDLSRQIDRNQLEIMGKVWSVDAVAKNASTSFYGSIVSLSESPVREDLIFVGTDDGLVQVTEDGGDSWHRYEEFPGVPSMSYVGDLEASSHAASTVYAAFDNHKKGDFKPYLLKSTDSGQNWISIAGDLPERGSVHSIMEDHKNSDLLFVGTEFGVFFTADGGQRWVQLKGGIPPIAVRDLDVQRRENDLVVGTFGRGIYVLDDYSLLRSVNEEALQQEATLFPVKNPWMYIQDSPLGGRDKAYQGDSLFTAPNPPFGAVISYYLKESVKTKKKSRQEAEKETSKQGGTISYPTWDELRSEAREEEPTILLSVRDEDGNIVRRLKGAPTAGVHRIAWDLRYPPSAPVQLRSDSDERRSPRGPLAMPGKYSVTLERRAGDHIVQLAQPQEFEAQPLGTATLGEVDREALLKFQKKTARLQRAVLGSVRALDEAAEQLSHLKQAVFQTPAANQDLYLRARELENQIKDLEIKLTGDSVRQSHNAPVPPSISGRVNGIVSGHWSSTSAPTQTQVDAYEIAAEEFTPVLKRIQTLLTKDLRELEDQVEAAGGPWTPGRVPRWEQE